MTEDPNNLSEKPIDAFETSGTSPTAAGANGLPESNSTTQAPPEATLKDESNPNTTKAEKEDKKDKKDEKDEKDEKDKPSHEDLAKKVLRYIEDQDGRFLSINGELYAVHVTSGGGRYRHPLQRGDLKLDQILLDAVHLTHSEQAGRAVIDRVRVYASEKASQVKYACFSLYVPTQGSAGTILVCDSSISLIGVGAEGIRTLQPSEAKAFYLESVGQPWSYRELEPVRRLEVARAFCRYLGEAQSRPPEGRVALALALSAFPFIRECLDMRPIFQFSGAPESGKSFTADRFAHLIYGHSGLVSMSEAALRRTSDPLILLDDVERLPQWMIDQLRRAATGISNRTAQSAGVDYVVQDNGERNAIHLLTAIRIPADSPLLSRLWLFTFSKEHRNPEFRNELHIREEIVRHRDEILSFLLSVLAGAFKLQEKEGFPDLSSYGPLPAPRTMSAHAYLLLLLRAFDEVAPGMINPDEEFRGFIKSLRREEETLRGQTTVELTLLSNILDDLENGVATRLPPRVSYEDGYLTISADRLSRLLNETARAQGVRLREMSAVNTGLWIGSEVRNSREFTVEATSVGSGNQKRKVWRIGRKGDS